MKTIAALLVPFLAILLSQFPFSGIVDVPGGQGLAPCNAKLFNQTCEGSYIGSTGCGASSVTRYAIFGWATKLKSGVSIKDCSNFVDTLNVPCNALPEQRVLEEAACQPNWLVIPIF